MIIPSKIKIGAHTVSIDMTENDLAVDGVTDPMYAGTCSVLSNKIVLKTISKTGDKIPESVMADTFMHEILHFASGTFGLELTEAQVTGTAGAMLYLIRENGLDFLNTHVHDGDMNQ